MAVKQSSSEPNQATERDIFLAALERSSGPERRAFLQQACGNDPALMASVEALLDHHRQDGFLETPVVESLHSPALSSSAPVPKTVYLAIEKPGSVIGHYKLLQQIGEGGVGTVFMAEQERPVRRRVALKVLKPGMDTRSVIARFESERQALAMMDHPNIAKVFDAGATDAGRPYFVMELVRGIRITDYCDQNQLPTAERLLLFIRVCQAIQHAHQKGVIHRDIKPSNILVTLHDGVPVPKVIDFGIAKAIDQRLTDKTLFTEFQAFIGTPAYMSPEQAEMSGLDIDTRTDVYSLGVLLYEMLTGKTPFDPQALLSSGLDGMRKTIREQEPVAPSTRLRTMLHVEQTTTAQRHRCDPGKLTNMLRGDLDWIVLKALEKDRTRRYETANDLAQDVERYLNNEPISARPPSALYRFQKMARRNRLLVGASAGIALALLSGLALTSWQYYEKNLAYQKTLQSQRQEAKLRHEAERARERAEGQALAARRISYAADMNVVQQALDANNLGRAQEILNRQRPKQGQADLRGWEWRHLWLHCQSDALFTLCQRSNEVHDLAASADGKWLAVAESTGEVSLHDLRARQAVSAWSSAGPRPMVRFAPNRAWLAFTSGQGRGFAERRDRLRIWDAEERQFIADIELSGMCRGLAFAAQGDALVAVTSGGHVSRWSLPDGELLSQQPMRATGWMGAAVQISRDLKLAAVALDEGRIAVVDLATGKELWNQTAAEEMVRVMAFSPDGRLLASGAGFVESAVRLWDSATGMPVGRLDGHRTWVSSLVFWPDGQTLASASADQTVRIWDVSQIRPMSPRFDFERRPRPWRPERPGLRQVATLRGHKLEVWSLALLPDNSTLISGSKDGSVYVWDTRSLGRDRAQFVLSDPARAWRFTSDGGGVLTLESSGRVVRWSGTEFQEKAVILELESMSSGPMPAVFSADGSRLAYSTTNRTLQVWDLIARRPIELPGLLLENAMPVGFMGSSQHLVLRQFPNNVHYEWDLESGREVRSWTLNKGPIFGFGNAYSYDGQSTAFVGEDGRLALMELASGEIEWLDTGIRQVTQIAFSPHGNLLALASRAGRGALCSVRPARLLAPLQGFLQAMNSVAFSPDARRLAIGGDGNEAIKLWDVESFQEVMTLEGEGSGFGSVAFSADGNLIGSTNAKGKLHIWRAPTMDEIDRRASAEY